MEGAARSSLLGTIPDVTTPDRAATAPDAYVRPHAKRRPSGEPPALPRAINTSGKWWLALALSVVGLWVAVALTRRTGMTLDTIDHAVLERVVVQGIVAAAVDVVRGVGVLVRGAQSGFVRAYALLLIGGFAALGLYFLIVSSG